MKRLHDRWIVFQLALLLCLVHGWCACGDVRTAFCINAGFVRDDIQKLKDYLPTRDAAYFLPTLRGWCVNFTDGFCVPVLAGQVAKEHVQQCYQAHEALHKIMHKKVTVEQRYLEELAADKSDVLLLSFGSVGYEHQQIPRFFERFVMQFPQSSFAIFSAGKPCDPATDFSVFSQKGTRTRPFN